MSASNDETSVRRPHVGFQRRSILLGAAIGLAAPIALGWTINNTTLADRVVTPLQLPDTSGNADAIVVLGAGAYEPCGCNLSALRRTELAVKLFEQGRASRMVFTGGPTADTMGTAVAHYMATLARRLGVPAEAILEEDKATTTAENALLASELLRSRNIKTILLVTDSLHMRRTDASFRKFGFAIERASVPQACVSSSNVDMLFYALHEYAGWCFYRLKGSG